jgi:hypothetical protein
VVMRSFKPPDFFPTKIKEPIFSASISYNGQTVASERSIATCTAVVQERNNKTLPPSKKARKQQNQQRQHHGKSRTGGTPQPRCDRLRRKFGSFVHGIPATRTLCAGRTRPVRLHAQRQGDTAAQWVRICGISRCGGC